MIKNNKKKRLTMKHVNAVFCAKHFSCNCNKYVTISCLRVHNRPRLGLQLAVKLEAVAICKIDIYTKYPNTYII